MQTANFSFYNSISSIRGAWQWYVNTTTASLISESFSCSLHGLILLRFIHGLQLPLVIITNSWHPHHLRVSTEPLASFWHLLILFSLPIFPGLSLKFEWKPFRTYNFCILHASKTKITWKTSRSSVSGSSSQVPLDHDFSDLSVLRWLRTVKSTPQETFLEQEL